MCTSFRLGAGDGSVVVGRTMEFPDAMGANIVALPVGFTATASAPSGPGGAWTATHGVVGMDAFGSACTLSDGMNDAGLYVGLQYMPGFCDYTPADGVAPERLVAITDVVALLLGTVASVAEATATISDLVVWPMVVPQMGMAPPAHLILHDASGDSAVVEWVDGDLRVLPNPIGVATNGPYLDWHLTNLRGHLNLGAASPSGRRVGGVELDPMGQGFGMVGLPGDSSPASRFLRAVALTVTLRPLATAADAELAALHVLNNFDIPFGFVRSPDDDPTHDDHTLWSTIADLTTLAYSVRTYDDPTPRRIALADVDFGGPVPLTIPLPVGGFPALTF